MKIIIFVLGVVLGLVIAIILKKCRCVNPSGTIRVDSSDPDGPFLFLELNEDLNAICSKDKIVCKIDNSSYISQK